MTIPKPIVALFAELVFIAAGGYVGSWWPMRNVRPGEDTSGDGIGIFLFGGLGVVAGGLIGLFVIALVWSMTRRRRPG